MKKKEDFNIWMLLIIIFVLAGAFAFGYSIYQNDVGAKGSPCRTRCESFNLTWYKVGGIYGNTCYCLKDNFPIEVP